MFKNLIVPSALVLASILAPAAIAGEDNEGARLARALDRLERQCARSVSKVSRKAMKDSTIQALNDVNARSALGLVASPHTELATLCQSRPQLTLSRDSGVAPTMLVGTTPADGQHN